MVVHSDNSDDDLLLVQHDAWVDLNPGGVRIRYTQEPALLAKSPSSSPPPYIVVGRWARDGCGKVLIPNPNYKGKGHTDSISSNPEPRMERRCPPKICGPVRMTESSNDDTEETKDEASDELVATVKQRITALE
jgi:hypothetical protein